MSGLMVMTSPQHRFRMPPEWAPRSATWLSWPHNRETRPSDLEEAEAALVEGVAALAGGEPVHINVWDSGHASRVRELFAGRVRPERFVIESDATIVAPFIFAHVLGE